jgi:glycolate oxidase iron-sulfur subunit
MQTNIILQLLDTSAGKRADEILRKCVHCGFCTATCPTYQLLGNELDGPRGRIYQIKQMLEGQPADRETLQHLDRCLTCRSCETTCPSGVNYAELIDIGRVHIEKQGLRATSQKLIRQLLGEILPYPSRHQWLFKMGAIFRPLLPAKLSKKIPAIRQARNFSQSPVKPVKTVLLLEGCVQSSISPNTNSAAVLLLQSLGYEVIREGRASCCGAVNQHLSQTEKAEKFILSNLENWSRINSQQALDAIVSTASGCGIMLKDYPHILSQMPPSEMNPVGMQTEYHLLCEKIVDISELLEAATLQQNVRNFGASSQRIAYHAPCTLTHGHKQADALFQQLCNLGYQLDIPQNAHLCCGSAGTYSLLQPKISQQLQHNKINALNECSPDIIITANVGCEHHLDSASDVPVRHWVEVVADDIQRCLKN